MAGAFSGHLLDSMQSAQFRSQGAFGQPSHLESNRTISGPMSFNPNMHGHATSQSFNLVDDTSYLEMSQATILKIAKLQDKLNQKLGPEYLSQRPGPSGGPKLTYAEGWKIINLANEVFGFNGWSSTIVNLTVDYMDFSEETRRYNVGVSAVIRVTLRDGVFHEDIGFGSIENVKQKGQAIDKCKKEAVTDGLKRAIRHFGNLLGNCLYDKSYVSEVTKIKVAPPKFDRSALHRRPEFEEKTPDVASTSASTSAIASSSSSSKPLSANCASLSRTNSSNLPQATVKTEAPITPAMQPPAAAPIHRPSPSNIPQVNAQIPQAAHKNTPRSGMGLNTPITTPVQKPVPSAVSYRPTTNGPGPSSDHQTLRKVAFENPPAARQLPSVMSDENYSFGSDDDLVAMMDLGDDDMGRPIDHEEGLGGALEEYEVSMAVEPERAPPPPAQTHQPRKANSYHTSRLQEQQVQQQVQQQSSSRLMLGLSSTTGSSSSSTASPSGMLSNLLPNPGQFQQRPIQRTSSSSTLRQSLVAAITKSNENEDGSARSTGDADSFKAPNAPVIGGFNFPSGIGPSGRPSQQQQEHMGMKRKAEGPTIEPRRPAPGMGLMSGQGQGHAQRQPFGRLDLGDGGEVKRMRM